LYVVFAVLTVICVPWKLIWFATLIVPTQRVVTLMFVAVRAPVISWLKLRICLLKLKLRFEIAFQWATDVRLKLLERLVMALQCSIEAVDNRLRLNLVL
jgi:hypothetical protein